MRSMKFLLDVEKNSEGDDECPGLFAVEVNETDLERLLLIQKVLKKHKAKETSESDLFSSAGIEWLGGDWLEDRAVPNPEDYLILADCYDYGEAFEKDEGASEFTGLRGEEARVNRSCVSWECYSKDSGVVFSAWSLNLKSLQEAFEIDTPEKALLWVNSENKYVKHMSRQILGGIQ